VQNNLWPCLTTTEGTPEADASCGDPPTAFKTQTRLRILQLDDSAAHANRDGLCAITCPQLLHDVLNVNFYSLLGD